MKTMWTVGSKLSPEEVREVLDRYGLTLVGDAFDVAGLPPAALLVLWRMGFSPAGGDE